MGMDCPPVPALFAAGPVFPLPVWIPRIPRARAAPSAPSPVFRPTIPPGTAPPCAADEGILAVSTVRRATCDSRQWSRRPSPLLSVFLTLLARSRAGSVAFRPPVSVISLWTVGGRLRMLSATRAGVVIITPLRMRGAARGCIPPHVAASTAGTGARPIAGHAGRIPPFARYFASVVSPRCSVPRGRHHSAPPVGSCCSLLRAWCHAGVVRQHAPASVRPGSPTASRPATALRLPTMSPAQGPGVPSGLATVLTSVPVCSFHRWLWDWPTSSGSRRSLCLCLFLAQSNRLDDRGNDFRQINSVSSGGPLLTLPWDKTGEGRYQG